MNAGIAKAIGYVATGAAFVMLYGLTSGGQNVVVYGFSMKVWMLGFALYVLGVVAAWGLTAGKRS